MIFLIFEKIGNNYQTIDERIPLSGLIVIKLLIKGYNTMDKVYKTIDEELAWFGLRVSDKGLSLINIWTKGWPAMA